MNKEAVQLTKQINDLEAMKDKLKRQKENAKNVLDMLKDPNQAISDDDLGATLKDIDDMVEASI